MAETENTARGPGKLQVDAVLGKREEGGVEYLVKWTTEGERPRIVQSWEKREAFEPQELVEEFEQKAGQDGSQPPAATVAELAAELNVSPAAPPAPLSRKRHHSEVVGVAEEEERERKRQKTTSMLTVSSGTVPTLTEAESSQESPASQSGAPNGEAAELPVQVGRVGALAQLAAFGSDDSSDSSYGPEKESNESETEGRRAPLERPYTDLEAEQLFFLSSNRQLEAGFKHGDSIEVILGIKPLMYHGDRILMAFVKWKEKPVCSFIPLFEARIRVPQLLLDYYESSLEIAE